MAAFRTFLKSVQQRISSQLKKAQDALHFTKIKENVTHHFNEDTASKKSAEKAFEEETVEKETQALVQRLETAREQRLDRKLFQEEEKEEQATARKHAEAAAQEMQRESEVLKQQYAKEAEPPEIETFSTGALTDFFDEDALTNEINQAIDEEDDDALLDRLGTKRGYTLLSPPYNNGTDFLNRAIEQDSSRAVSLLLKYGAKDDAQFSVLKSIIAKGWTSSFKQYLQAHSTDAEILDVALQEAIRRNNPEIVQIVDEQKTPLEANRPNWVAKITEYNDDKSPDETPQNSGKRLSRR